MLIMLPESLFWLKDFIMLNVEFVLSADLSVHKGFSFQRL